MRRREFIAAGIGAAAGAALGAGAEAEEARGIRVRFLGTGAADWGGRDSRGELRRFSSILCDNRLLFDFTRGGFDLLPDGVRPKTLFYTHSHDDHYNPAMARKLGVRRVYLQEGWLEIAKAEFAAVKEGEMPEIIPLKIGQAVEAEGLRITPLPANHATDYLQERTLIYLVEKGATRMLYATDTACITAWAHALIGVKPLTAIITECTIGLGHEDDSRIFSHSSVGMIQHALKALVLEKRYAPPAGQPVWLTHLARTLHGTQAELDASLPAPLKAAHDGLELALL